jgi:hypothetical protein
LTQLELLTTEESLITIDASVAASDAALIANARLVRKLNCHLTLPDESSTAAAQKPVAH